MKITISSLLLICSILFISSCIDRGPGEVELVAFEDVTIIYPVGEIDAMECLGFEWTEFEEQDEVIFTVEYVLEDTVVGNTYDTQNKFVPGNTYTWTLSNGITTHTGEFSVAPAFDYIEGLHTVALYNDSSNPDVAIDTVEIEISFEGSSIRIKDFHFDRDELHYMFSSANSCTSDVCNYLMALQNYNSGIKITDETQSWYYWYCQCGLGGGISYRYVPI